MPSTSETYGDPQVHPQPETYWGRVNPVGPRGVYDETKRFGEALTTACRRTLGVDTAISRNFNTFGERTRPDDERAIPTFASPALQNTPITVVGDGTQTRPIIYVEDLIEGIVRMAQTNHPGPMNLGNPHELSMLQQAELVRDLAGSSSPITLIPRPQDDPFVRQPDISLARRALDWEPKVDVRDEFSRTMSRFRDHSPALG